MGLFDYVNFECDCPGCGAKLKGFQTKDRACVLDTLMPWEVDCFYTSCDNCGLWVEFRRKGSDAVRREPPPEPPGWREEFEIKTRTIESFRPARPEGESD